MEYKFVQNIVGVFIFDEKDNLIDKVLFKSREEYLNPKQKKEKLLAAYPGAKQQTTQDFAYFASKEMLNLFRSQNISLTRSKIKATIGHDNLISQAVNSLKESDKYLNTSSKRLREWYSFYLPELSKKCDNHMKFVQMVYEMDKKELIKQYDIDDTMGADLSKADIDIIKSFAQKVIEISHLRSSTDSYLDTLLSKHSPNLKELLGTTLAAKLIEHTGSLRRLAMLPASTVQILGAEKALFRHLRTGAKPPRHGIILEHPLVSKATQKERGKRSRALADKISIAAKVDFFKGDFIADKLKKELGERFR